MKISYFAQRNKLNRGAKQVDFLGSGSPPIAKTFIASPLPLVFLLVQVQAMGSLYELVPLRGHHDGAVFPHFLLVLIGAFVV